jgi:hypothetical protein
MEAEAGMRLRTPTPRAITFLTKLAWQATRLVTFRPDMAHEG